MSSFTAIASNPLVENLGWTLLHFVWQGAVLALALGFVLLLLRGSAPNLRYIASCVALLLLAVSPFVTYARLTATVGDTPLALASGSTEEADPHEGLVVAEVAEPLSDGRGGVHGASSVAAKAAPSGPALLQRLTRLFEPVLPWLALGWLLGVSALSLRLMGGWIQAERLKRHRVTSVGEQWVGRLTRLSESLGVTRSVRLLNSAIVETPVLIGWLRPVILLPMSTILGLTEEQVEAILAHELAHVRRGDYLVRLIQSLVETLLFYHPAVWWVSRQISIEREYCCDDLAAAACGDKVSYARALTGLEQLRGVAPQLSLAAQGGSLLARIRRLLAGAPDHARSAARWQGGLIAVATAVALVIAVQVSVSAADTDRDRSASVAATAAPAESAEAAEAPEPLQTAAAPAQLQSPPVAPASNAVAAKPVGVALVEFARIGSADTLGEASAQLYELVGERLASAPSIRFVERDKLDEAMKEVHLSQTGLIEPGTAAQIGRIVGARYFVAGKLMKFGDEYVTTVRLINTQTSEVTALRFASPEAEGVLALADGTADKIIERLGAAASVAAPSGEEDPYAAEIAVLRAQLADRKLPTLAVCVPESHIGTWAPDPAGENEMIRVLSEVGYPIVDIKTLMEREAPSWWATLFRGPAEEGEGREARLTIGSRSASDLMHDKRIATIKEKADIIVIGEAFSEYAGEHHGFRSCKARVEVKAIDTGTESVAAAASKHASGADIAELIAGKKALRAAGGQVGLELARALAEYPAPGRKEKVQ